MKSFDTKFKVKTFIFPSKIKFWTQFEILWISIFSKIFIKNFRWKHLIHWIQFCNLKNWQTQMEIRRGESRKFWIVWTLWMLVPSFVFSFKPKGESKFESPLSFPSKLALLSVQWTSRVLLVCREQQQLLSSATGSLTKRNSTEKGGRILGRGAKPHWTQLTLFLLKDQMSWTAIYWILIITKILGQKGFLLTVKLTNQNFVFSFQSWKRKSLNDAEKL